VISNDRPFSLSGQTMSLMALKIEVKSISKLKMVIKMRS
jgi:hypothetical protein